ncbi:MAG: OsmC family protein [Planctomycetaceae bacterium]
MNAEQLRTRQAPLKSRYAESPASACAQFTASGRIDMENLVCRVDTPAVAADVTTAGLHVMAGGDGTAVCAGEMLLQSLVACSGVTFAAVATAMGLEIRSAGITAAGEMDFRGTLGVDRQTPVGFTKMTLTFDIDSDEAEEKIAKLIQLTERYCVVLQTLQHSCEISSVRMA